MIRSMLLVGVGSFAGGALRYLISAVVQNRTQSKFPIGTLFVNIAGCFIIGVLLGLFERGHISNRDLNLLLAIGFCGGFTTFSSFISENMTFMRAGQFELLIAHLALSVITGYAALFAGSILSSRI
jgi:fluoride exporter